MKIVSWNVNGIRACIGKGFWDWYDRERADVVCLQETKITESDFLKLAQNHDLTPLVPTGGNTPPLPQLERLKREHPVYFVLAAAKKPGYSGTAILTKIKPKNIEIGIGIEKFDAEGRVLFADFEKFLLVNTYFPNGGRELKRVPFKLEFSDALLKKLKNLRKKQKNIVVCGDMNVAHTEIDIKNPGSNVKNSGFTPIEREWFTKFLGHEYLDSFRHLYPDARDVYTWWSYRPGVREKNIGWRIDYFVVTPEMMRGIKDSAIQKDVMGSDHCPIVLELKH